MISSNFKQKIFIIFISSILFSCKQNDCSFTERLLIEQSKELTLANGREFYNLIEMVLVDNLKQNKKSSKEFEQLEKLHNELNSFKAEMKKANRAETIRIINQQNEKFKNEEAFAKKYFKFEPVKVELYKNFDDDVFKFYATSKISRFYVLSGSIIYKRHFRKQNPGII